MAGSKRIPDLLAGVLVALVILFMFLPLRGFSGTLSGHMLGILGTAFMVKSLDYPFRKRVLKQKVGRKSLLSHIYFGLLGPILVVVHAGSFQASPIGTIAFLAMLLVVLSGIAGNILFVRVSRNIREHQGEFEALKEYYNRRRKDVDEFHCLNLLWGRPLLVELFFDAELEKRTDRRTLARCRELRDIITSMAEVEATIQAFATTKRLFTFWITVHIYGTWLLLAMILVHVGTTLYYGMRWLP
jgi:hypothetical protein